MKCMLTKGITLLLVLAVSLPSFSQDPEAALAAFNKKLPTEKIYIHYDRDHYNAGETMWFKAYVYSNGLPSAFSHNLYVQLVNAAGQVIDKKVYPIAGATANGSIQLPDSLPAGSYYIRAVTPNMLNHDEQFVYRKSIPVYAAGKSTAEGKLEKRPYTVQFFPEGGNLVDGIITVTAIRSRDKFGYPVSLSGVIRSNAGTVMTSFKTSADGYGRVQFKPAVGQTYTGEVEADGRKYVFPLPPVQAGGVNIRITDEKDGKLFQLTRGEAQRDKYQSITLLAQLNNEVVYRNVVPFDDYLSVRGRLNTQALPSGVLHFTVFNSEGLPIAERLSFVNNKTSFLTPEIVVGSKSFDARGENKLQLNFPQDMKGVFSVSVTDASVPVLRDRGNIFSGFLLNGDLKDHVFNGTSYFERSDDSTKRALDNMLLTQSWSRFNWNQLLKNELPAAKYKDHYLRSLSGVVTDEKTGDRIYGGVLNLFLEGGDSTSQNYNVPVNNTGKFVLDSLLFWGEGRVLYTYTEGKKPPKVNITLDRTKMDSIAAVVPPVWAEIRSITPGRDEVMNSWSPKAYAPLPVVRVVPEQKPDAGQTEQGTQKRTKDVANEKYASGVWKTGGRVVYEESMKTNATTSVLDYILQTIPNVKMQGSRLVNSKNMSIGSGQNWDVGVFIDENPVTLGQLQAFQMREVGLIKFYEAGFVGVGTMFPGGGVAIYRKKGNEAKKMGGELPSVPYTGYSLNTDFSRSPDANPPVGQADNRKLLYWNPSLYIEPGANTVNITFRNNDRAKKYRVVVEGFDATGKLLYFEKIIE